MVVASSSRDVVVSAFRAASSSSTPPLPSYRRRSRRSASAAASSSSSHGEERAPGGTIDDDDCDDNSSSGGIAHLRKVTFLGLTAAPPIDDDDDDVDALLHSSSLDARALSEFLMEIGASSVSVTDSDCGTDSEDPIFGSARQMLDDDEQRAEELLLRSKYAMVLPDSAVGRNLWRRCDVSAHFPYSFDVSYVVDAVRDAFDCGDDGGGDASADDGDRRPALSYAVEDVPDLDWITHVQSSWEPIVTDGSKFVLRFPWHDDARVMRACQERERIRMMEVMKRKFDGGVKREGAVVHFEEEDDEGTEEEGEEEDDDESTIRRKEKDAGVGGAAPTTREYVQIRLEGGVAFGTGEHPTTRMCLNWVRDRVERYLGSGGDESDRRDDSDDEAAARDLHFLDYGAGSGVLGIAAAAIVRDHNDRSRLRSRRSSSSSPSNPSTSSKGGTRSITTVGVEIDADAIHIANDNARRNDIEMQNYLPDFDTLDDEATSVVLRAMQRERNKDGSIMPIPNSLNGNMYDLCAANILAHPLVNLAPTIAKLVRSPGGEIGLSGVLKSQAEMVVGAYSEYFDDVRVAEEDGGWVLITGMRK